MGLPEPIRFFLEPLEAAGLDYCVTGSVAAAVYGEPRLTRDIDLVMLLKLSEIGNFRTWFPEEDFYVPPTEVLVTEVLRTQRGCFNLVHHSSGFKADIFLAAADPLHAWALANRRRGTLGSGDLWLAPPEYVVLRKLEFLREGRQEKHLRDVGFIVHHTVLDRAFIEQHAIRLGLQAEWAAGQRGAQQ